MQVAGVVAQLREPLASGTATVYGLAMPTKHPKGATVTMYHTLSDLAGYVVRETIDAAGELIERDQADVFNASSLPNYPQFCRVGRDVATFDGPGAYGAALDRARTYRDGRGYAVVDPVYTDGHRSMA
jgi:hypothetical protein